MRDLDSDGYVDETRCTSCGGELGGGTDFQHTFACPYHPSRYWAKGGLGNRTPAAPPGGWPQAGDADDILDFGGNASDLQPLTRTVGQILSHAPRMVGAEVFSATDGVSL